MEWRDRIEVAALDDFGCYSRQKPICQSGRSHLLPTAPATGRLNSSGTSTPRVIHQLVWQQYSSQLDRCAQPASGPKCNRNIHKHSGSDRRAIHRDQHTRNRSEIFPVGELVHSNRDPHMKTKLRPSLSIAGDGVGIRRTKPGKDKPTSASNRPHRKENHRIETGEWVKLYLKFDKGFFTFSKAPARLQASNP